ncbi:hypothetical protein E7811_02105 [Aliigemmobacter aestuarii]|uniref:Capsular biosynthesis protein n=1 Tax=Aliigemmobacter aestuarii TaxID=1445661 RepID=A0A4S3MQ94_9RHOB|nr:hypothetical protein [Gemmobacter aestuarii]THD84557.1 hypothetical protein E7811_02105 [Gemmobacter aestuarii]
MGEFVLHLPDSQLQDPARLKPFYRRLADGLAEAGHAVRLIRHDRDRIEGEVAADTAFHIVDHGRIQHPRVLNAGIAYVYPFWNLDPHGIRALSSIAAMPFDAGTVDGQAARAFMARQRQRLVAARVSRYDQPQDVAPVPSGCIAVFLQSEAHRDLAETCYLSLREMVGAVIARDDPRPIVIKPHPRDLDPETREFLHRIARKDARVQVMDANIHDILAACDCVVTINSAVGIEAMFHRKPVVLCGRADFHHNAVPCHRAGAVDRAIGKAMRRNWPHGRFLYWYFGIQCVNAMSETLVEDVLERVRAAGHRA